MKFQFISPAAVLLTSACMGGGSGSGNNQTAAEAAQLINPGTTSTTQSATGLAFAEDVGGEPSIEGPLTITVARFVTDYSSGQSRIVVSKEDINVTDAEEFEGTLTLGDETLVFVYDDVENVTTATLSNGQIVGTYRHQDGEFVSAVAIYSYDRDDPATGFDFEAFSLIGFETNPADLPSGYATYESSGFGYGNYLIAGSVAEQEVKFVIDALMQIDFDNLEVDGEIFLEVLFDEGSGFVDLELVTADLEGNGFGTTAFCTSGCTESNSVVGGAFYGPEADELAGLLALDISEGDERFVGAGSFIGSEDLPE